MGKINMYISNESQILKIRNTKLGAMHLAIILFLFACFHRNFLQTALPARLESLCYGTNIFRAQSKSLVCKSLNQSVHLSD